MKEIPKQVTYLLRSAEVEPILLGLVMLIKSGWSGKDLNELFGKVGNSSRWRVANPDCRYPEKGLCFFYYDEYAIFVASTGVFSFPAEDYPRSRIIGWEELENFEANYLKNNKFDHEQEKYASTSNLNSSASV